MVGLDVLKRFFPPALFYDSILPLKPH